MFRAERVVTRFFRVSLPKEYSARLDALVRKGIFITYSEAVRRAIELLLEKYREDGILEHRIT